jgi:predicted metalloendopeptidase
MNSDIPIALQQSPYFVPSLPPLINFATIGSTIGHEFSHAFDPKGVNIGAFGNEIKWEDKTPYEQRSNCFVRQYSSYQDDELLMNVNGRHTLNENMADNGGLALAYYAYRLYRTLDQFSIDRVGDEQVQSFERLPAPLDQFGADQQFFIAYAGTFCSAERSESMRHQLQRSAYSPNRYRVNGALSNFRPFADAFHCTINDPMNPNKKCHLW